MPRISPVLNGMVWYGMVWYGMVWYGPQTQNSGSLVGSNKADPNVRRMRCDTYRGKVWQRFLRMPHSTKLPFMVKNTHMRGNRREKKSQGVQLHCDTTQHNRTELSNETQCNRTGPNCPLPCVRLYITVHRPRQHGQVQQSCHGNYID